MFLKLSEEILEESAPDNRIHRDPSFASSQLKASSLQRPLQATQNLDKRSPVLKAGVQTQQVKKKTGKTGKISQQANVCNITVPDPMMAENRFSDGRQPKEMYLTAEERFVPIPFKASGIPPSTFLNLYEEMTLKEDQRQQDRDQRSKILQSNRVKYCLICGGYSDTRNGINIHYKLQINVRI